MLKNLNFSWMTDIKYVAQFAHILFGLSIILLANLFFIPLLLALILFVFYTGYKEFYFDINYETPKGTIKDGILDFSMYNLGYFLGYLCILIANFV